MVTFVSAYYTLESTPYFNLHPEEWDPAPIFELARTGIQLCLYIGPTCTFESAFEELEKECPNFRVMPYRLYFKDMWIYHALTEWKDVNSLTLPVSRNMDKDTLEYMIYMHSRHEIIEDAISENPWDSTHFAWIDFNAPRLFSKKEESFSRLLEIAKYPFQDETLYFSGCWSKLDVESAKNITVGVNWRFCGSFFLGDVKSLTNFAELYREYFPVYLKVYGVFTWEVNFWAWLEYNCGWMPTWYRGDHNDTMLNIFSGVSADTYAVQLSPEIIVSKKEYVYPTLDEPFLPGSASYLEYEGKHYLNTRFVNYWMYPNGYYKFYNPEFVIENRNFCSILDERTLEPLDFRMMDESILYGIGGESLKVPEREKRAFSEGLEDIRLFNGNGCIRFIATNVEYSPVSKNRMIIGTYDMDTATYRDCILVIPPDPNSWCEKNWIPVIVNGEEHFIYKWSPMEIGKVNPMTNQLEIVRQHKTEPWIFSRLRGSTTFVDAPMKILPNGLDLVEGGYLVGLVHFSEEHSPRHYYHLLVLLEKNTLKPVRYSKIFYFEKLSIEFCIGMTVREEGEKYVFWVSRFDRDPICIEVKTSGLPFDSII